MRSIHCVLGIWAKRCLHTCPLSPPNSPQTWVFSVFQRGKQACKTRSAMPKGTQQQGPASLCLGHPCGQANRSSLGVFSSLQSLSLAAHNRPTPWVRSLSRRCCARPPKTLNFTSPIAQGVTGREPQQGTGVLLLGLANLAQLSWQQGAHAMRLHDQKRCGLSFTATILKTIIQLFQLIKP